VRSRAVDREALRAGDELRPKLESRFSRRHRANVRASLRRSGTLLLLAGLLVAGTAGPFFLGVWDTAVPGGIGIAIAALLVVAVVVSTPLELVASVALYFDRDHNRLPRPGGGFGRALYRASDRLDALALDAGLTPLSDFESDDPLASHEAPTWHPPQAALATVVHLLARVDPAEPLHRHLTSLRDALQAAEDTGARFYFLVKSWGGATNARVEALRQGDSSVLAER
jgi:hypothetical protein